MSLPAITLNDNHRNTLLAGFSYIDRLLADALVSFSSGGDQGAIFSPVVPDATPVQRKVVADQVARLRRAMRAALEACDIPVRPPTVSAIWSLRNVLIAVDIALEDFGPNHLRGYGPIDDETAAGVSALRAQIRTVVAEMENYLASGLGGDLAARLARLDQTTDEVRLLREIERIVTTHGLAEFRQPLAHLLGRLEMNWWTVAFVGRVSCGKSSLLNFLLETDVLPSGVTPVTAVPIRIVAGAEPFATIRCATGDPERIPAIRLGEFASEDLNPGNARFVTDILLELPATRLAGAICFVDTPGLGSLATSGAAQTLAFLPRCDVGVLMIDAAATLSEEDIGIARSLLEGGAEVTVVVSKADLVTPADCEKMRAYFARQFSTALGQELAIVPVSVAANHTALADAWWTDVLAPRQTRHAELAALTLRRKIGALREAVIAALARRVGRPVQQAGAPDAPAQLGAARAAIEATDRGAYDLSFKTMPSADAVIESTAATIAASPPEDDISAAIAQAFGQAAAQFAGGFEKLLNETRALAERTLTSAAGAGAVPHDFFPPTSRPLFDPAPVLAAGTVSPSWQRWPTTAGRRAALRRQLRSLFGEALHEALRHYGHALIGWSHRYLDDLGAQFTAQAGFVEAVSRSAAPGERVPASPEVTRDLDLLRDWNARPAA